MSDLEIRGTLLVALIGLGACGASGQAAQPAAQPVVASPETNPAELLTASAVPPAEVAVAAPEPAVIEPKAFAVRLTVMSAEIKGRMPNGEDWDNRSAPVPGGTNPLLAKYLEHHPELADTADSLGSSVNADDWASQAKASPAADPMVIVQVGHQVFRSPARLRAFNPVWEFPIDFLVGELEGRQGASENSLVSFHVVDFDGPNAFDTIGSTVVSLAELLESKLHRLGPFGSVDALTLVVQSVPLTTNRPPTITRLAVPATRSWTDTQVDLVAGMRVTIDAADEVCVNSDDLSYCTGPEGMRNPHPSNLPGFPGIGHASLVAALGDTRFPIRRSASFIAPSSGRLHLGVNDRNVVNNRGAFVVSIRVEGNP